MKGILEISDLQQRYVSQTHYKRSCTPESLNEPSSMTLALLRLSASSWSLHASNDTSQRETSLAFRNECVFRIE